ncbi:MAG: hypothetical protein FWH53_00540 [Leptospirales bacterium]|nr:hypothetical protein [Leptospirales bacterium]
MDIYSSFAVEKIILEKCSPFPSAVDSYLTIKAEKFGFKDAHDLFKFHHYDACNTKQKHNFIIMDYDDVVHPYAPGEFARECIIMLPFFDGLFNVYYGQRIKTSLFFPLSIVDKEFHISILKSTPVKGLFKAQNAN